MKRQFLYFFLLFVSASALALPYNGEIMSFRQADGSQVDVRLYGHEYYMRGEGLDGYTLIRDAATGWICYADLSADRKALVSIGIIYRGRVDDPASIRNELDLPRHLDLPEDARAMLMRQNMQALGASEADNILRHTGSMERGTPVHPVSGAIRGLSIVVDFPDFPGTLPMEEFEAFCNDLNYSNFGNAGSLRTYFADMSGGVVDYQNQVFGYFRAPLNYSHYDSLGFAAGAQQLLKIALEWIDSQGFDFSTLSTNPNGTIQAINIMFTGFPKAWGAGMWHHKGSFFGFEADGVKARDYNTSPANNPLFIGTIVHENGHMIGKWPDTYKYDSSTGADGLGSFDVMCAYGNSANPVPPNPLFRINAGWTRAIDVTDSTGMVSDTADLSTCYLYRNKNNPQEFFLLENRRQTGRSTFIPDEGLSIWHIDRNGDNQTAQHEVFLEHAHGNVEDHSGACFHAGYREEFAIDTDPNSLFYSGDDSKLRVWEIGASGDIMQYRLGDAKTGPILRISELRLGDDSNGDGSLEAGESASLRLLSANQGAADAAGVQFECRAIGPGAAYITVSEPVFVTDALKSKTTLPQVFDFTVDPSAPFGTEITLEVRMSYGPDTIVQSVDGLIGLIIPMDNVETSICEAFFFDDGVGEDYGLNKNYTKTFFPAGPQQRVRIHFQSFEIEDSPGCFFDYMKIYDGPGTDADLIGTYCGSDSPGEIISGHASGALTFAFQSDHVVSRPGWKAVVSCETISGTAQEARTEELRIFPNPSKGQFVIQNPSMETADCTVSDLLGRRVWQNSIGPSAQVNLNGRPGGLYWVQVRVGSIVYSEKVILNP